MIELLLPQLRLAASMMFGLRFSVRSLEQLVDAINETRRELGAVGEECRELLGPPALDEDSRRDVQLRRFRAQARRAARETPYYATLFERVDLPPERLRWEDIPRVPLTPKEALRENPEACATGSYGSPTRMKGAQ